MKSAILRFIRGLGILASGFWLLASISAASFQSINLGTNPNDGTGDNLRTGGQKINSNFLLSVINKDGSVTNLTSYGTNIFLGTNLFTGPLLIGGYQIYGLTNGANVTITTNAGVVTINATGGGSSDLDPAMLRTNASGQITAVTNRTLPYWINVAERGAVLDGSTDISAIVQAAVNSLPARKGGTIYIPGAAKFSGILITNHNVRFLGDSPIIDDLASSTNWWTPASENQPMFQIGDGTNLVRGFVLERATLYGQMSSTNGHLGLWFSGCANCLAYNSTVFGFRTNYLFAPSGTVPVTGNRVIGGRTQTHSTDTNQCIIYAYMTTNQSPYTTDNAFDNVKINVGSQAGNRAAIADGTYLQFSDCYFDINGDSGIQEMQSAPGVLTPYFVGHGNHLDGTGKVFYSVNNDQSWSDHIRGGWEINSGGKGVMLNGTIINAPEGSTLAPYRSRFNAPQIEIEAAFTDGTQTNFNDTSRIYLSGSVFNMQNDSPSGGVRLWGNAITLRGTNGITLNPLASDVTISPGNVILDNTKGITIKDNAGNFDGVLSVTSGNNVQLSSPNIGGYVQLTSRNTTNSGIQFLPEGVLTGEFDVNKNFNLYGVNLQMDNNVGLKLKDSSGTLETAVFVTSANNLQLNSPTSGGSIQATVRKGDQFFQVLFAGVKSFQAQSNLLSFNAPIIYTNGALAGAFLKSDASGNASWSLDGGTLTNVPGRFKTWTNMASGLQIDYAIALTNNFYRLLSGNVAFATVNEADTTFRLMTEQDSTGSRVVTFPANWLWTQPTNAPSTTPPGWSTNAGVIVEYEVERRNGTNYARIITDRDSVVQTDFNNGVMTSAEFAGQITDENGTGPLVMSTGASLTNAVMRAQTNADLTASQAVFTDANKKLVSNAITGSGSVVMGTGPTIASPVVSAQTNSDLTASQAVFTDTNKKLVSNAISGSGGVQMTSGSTSTNQTLVNPTISKAEIFATATNAPTSQQTNYTVTITAEPFQIIPTANTNLNFTFASIAAGQPVSIFVDAITSTISASIKWPANVLTNSGMVLTVTNGTARIYNLTALRGTDPTNVLVTAGDWYRR